MAGWVDFLVIGIVARRPCLGRPEGPVFHSRLKLRIALDRNIATPAMTETMIRATR